MDKPLDTPLTRERAAKVLELIDRSGLEAARLRLYAARQRAYSAFVALAAAQREYDRVWAGLIRAADSAPE